MTCKYAREKKQSTYFNVPVRKKSCGGMEEKLEMHFGYVLKAQGQVGLQKLRAKNVFGMERSNYTGAKQTFTSFKEASGLPFFRAE